MDGKRLGKDCFHGYGPTEIFWRGGIVLDFLFLMVIGDWNCHCYYRHSSLRWKKDVELQLYFEGVHHHHPSFSLKTEP